MIAKINQFTTLIELDDQRILGHETRGLKNIMYLSEN